jgi:hypothetical protein
MPFTHTDPDIYTIAETAAAIACACHADRAALDDYTSRNGGAIALYRTIAQAAINIEEQVARFEAAALACNSPATVWEIVDFYETVDAAADLILADGPLYDLQLAGLIRGRLQYRAMYHDADACAILAAATAEARQ